MINNEDFTPPDEWKQRLTPMTEQSYDSLTLEQKVERLEVVAQLYFGWINQDGEPTDPAKALREDCTRYWEEMKGCFDALTTMAEAKKK